MTAPIPSETVRTKKDSGLGLRAVVVAGTALALGIWLADRLDFPKSKAFSGRLQARVTTITAEWPARLQEIRVEPGERVAAGDPLFVLHSEQRQADLLFRRQEAARAEQEVIRVKAAADLELHWRRRELQSETFQTKFKLASLRQEKLHRDVEQIAWREQMLTTTAFEQEEQPAAIFRFLSDSAEQMPEERIRALLREDAAAMSAKALAAQITLCEQRLEELRILDESLEEDVRMSHGITVAEQLSQKAAAALATEEAVQSSAVVNSPGYGLVGLFRKQTGDAVQPGDVLLQILDDDRRSIEVEIPSWAAVQFTPGTAIQLEFPGHERRQGVVASMPPQTSGQDTDSDDTKLKLIIEPAGKLWPHVPIGSRVLVSQP